MNRDDSEFLAHIECLACGSSDARAQYSDGHEYCFACSDYKPGAGEPADVPRKVRKVSGLIPYAELELRALRARGISEETCRRFGYRLGSYRGQTVHVAPYFDAEGNLVAQHLRTKEKDFPWKGEPKYALPFGAHAWPKTGKRLVVCEGEVDALSMSQAQGNKWPVVSIGCGAELPKKLDGSPSPMNKIRKYIGSRLDYFRGFDEVVLMFDSDEQGRASAKVAAEIIGTTARIADLPMHDANDMLLAGRTEELINAMFRAKKYRPDGIVEISSLREEAKQVIEYGLSYPWPTLTKWTFGMRPNQLIALGAGVGGGKTDVFTQIIKHLIVEHNVPAGVFYMEQRPLETATRIAGKIAEKPLHLPQEEGNWTDAERDSAWDVLEQSGKLFLFDSFGNNEWEPIREKIEFLYHSEGVQYFFLDHLTALAAWQDDERKTLELIMSEMGGLVQKLPITIFFISHLATPEGKPHEEGGRVMARHLKGSRAIIQWATFILGVERDQQAEDEVIRSTSTVRSLKDRYAGRSNGKTYFLRYDFPTGMLNEVQYEMNPDHEDDTGLDTPEPVAKRSKNANV